MLKTLDAQTQQFREDVIAGLSAAIPAIPARWLYDRRDLIRRGHPFFQRYLCEDGLQLLVRIRESVEPLPIERSHNFGGDDRIYADSVIQQFGCPFARMPGGAISCTAAASMRV